MKINRKNAFLPPDLEDYVTNMSASDLDELRVLVYVLSKEETDTEEIQNVLGLSETEVVSAVSFWRGAGLIAVSGKGSRKIQNADPKKDTPDGEADKKNKETPAKLSASARDTDTRSYTGEEIARILEEKPELLSLLDFAQNRLEKVFSPSDISKLVYLEDYVLLTAPMIMRIIDYCVEIDKKSMRYVEKTALSIYDEGICDYDALEAYFERKRSAATAEGTVRRIVGIGARSFTSKEKEYISRWFDEFHSSEELITLAYEKTIANISKPSLAYMSKLLEVWHSKGYKTAFDVKEGAAASESKSGLDLDMFDEASAKKGDNKKGKQAGLDLDDFFENP